MSAADRHTQFQQLIVGLCQDLVEEEEEGGAHAARERALGRIGEYCQVDRCFVYQFDADLKHVSLVHEWRRAGKASLRDQMQRISTAPFQAGIAMLMAGQSVCFPDVQEVTEEHAALRAVYQQLGMRSVVNVPVRRGEQLLGYLGLAHYSLRPPWNDDELASLLTLGEVLVGAMERCRIRQELRHRTEFEHLVVELSGRFINQPIDGIDEAVEHALGQVAQFAEVQRCVLFRFAPDLKSASQTHEWHAEDVPPMKAEYQNFSTEPYPWAMDLLRQGLPVLVTDVQRMPSDSLTLQREFARRGASSVLEAPIFLRGQLVAFLGFARYGEPTAWTPDAINLLRLVGETLIGALVRAEADRELRRNEESLRLTIEAVGEGVYDWNIIKGQTYVSEHWLAMLGYPPGTNYRTGDQWYSAIHPDDRASVDSALLQHFVGGADRYEIKYRRRNARGEYRWILDRGRVIERTLDGRAQRMVGVDRDITDELTAERRQHELEAQLAHLSRVSTMGETVAGIAHEVNQPLHAAATFAAAARSALERDQPGSREKAIELAQKFSDQIVRAADIIRRLREFTRPRAAETTQLDLNSLIRETAQFVLEVSRKFEVRLQLELAEIDPPISGDSVQIQQVLVNLLRNALDACASPTIRDPQIKITSLATDEHVVVEVSDNGEGLARSVSLEHLFDPFFTTKEGGMGIGLALCRTIMEAHQGRISPQRNATAGMTFTLTFPRNLPGSP
jgi:PAS domain S-box-containing protein